jgi:hypothetical protein
MRWPLVLVVFLGSFAWVGCSDGATPEVDLDAAEGEDAADDADALSSGEEASVDSTLHEDGSTSDAGSDAPSTDSGKPTDAAKPDTTPAGDSSSTMFACGSETCSSKFQFCHKDTAPGTCPPVDAGVCPAGCPGCPALGLHCESLPSKCFAAPSCMCLVGEVCGFSGACDEMGGFTVGCKGI